VRSTLGWRCPLEFDRVLSGHRFILSVQETELERQEKELADDQAESSIPRREGFAIGVGETLWVRG
jgi:hypothetical protein